MLDTVTNQKSLFCNSFVTLHDIDNVFVQILSICWFWNFIFSHWKGFCVLLNWYALYLQLHIFLSIIIDFPKKIAMFLESSISTYKETCIFLKCHYLMKLIRFDQ